MPDAETKQLDIKQPTDSHIVDELLFERSITLRKIPFLWSLITKFCLPFFKYQQAVDWIDRLSPLDGDKALKQFSDFLDIKLDVNGIENVPAKGPLLIVANHPTGFVDAFAIQTALEKVRSDIVFFSNRDVVRIVPKTSEIIIPVEWMHERRSPESMRATLKAMRGAIDAKKAIVVFPSGGIARGSINGLKELDWLSTTVKLMRRFDLPILPVEIKARNTFLYYMFELIHDELRDLLRFREILAKSKQTFKLNIGSVVNQADLVGSAEDATKQLQSLVTDAKK